MRERRNEFREFYREIVDRFLADLSNIRIFIKKSMQGPKKKNKTNKKVRRNYLF